MVRSATAARLTEADDPVLAAFLRAPVDTRPETEEERALVEASKASARAAGRMVPHSEVVAALDQRSSE
jgi:hypothetical protein